MLDGIYNAKVEDVTLEFEDHGCLVFVLYLVHEGGHQAFGNINLMNRAQPRFDREGGNVTGWYIKRVFDICEVDKFSQLKGKAIRIREQDGLIKAIGNLIKDDWFCPEQDFTAPDPEDESEAPTDGE